MTGDLILIVMSLFLYIKYFYVYNIWPSKTLVENPSWVILILAIWLVYARVFTLYDVIHASKTGLLLRRTILVAFLTGVTYIAFPFLSPVFPKTRMPVYLFIGQLIFLLSLWHWLFSYIFQQEILRKRVLIVGAGWSGREILKELSEDNVAQQTGYQVIGFVDDDPDLYKRQIDGVRVIGNSEELFTYARRLRIDELILAVHTAKNIKGSLYSALVNCENYGIETVPVNIVYETVTGKLMVKKQSDEFLLTYDFFSPRKNSIYLFLNRLLNILFGLVGMALTVALIPLIFIGNLLFSRGPLFFVQERVGRDDRPFIIYKFRTMVVNAEALTGAVYAEVDDPRITFPGRIMRRARIDELPQFWNVFLGDMNLIGPRPERPEFIRQLVRTIGFYSTRHVVKPGITGWAQVNYKYGANQLDSLAKLQYDLYYIKNRSFFLDMKILRQTVGVMLRLKGN
jgi:exopolysaccharide biosynthesis polyprenyl glycosylphosphotransferase